MGSLATVERLSARLGMTLTPGSPDYARAEEALWSASARARSIADRVGDWADSATVPDAVVDVVLSAALRIYRNPDRFLINQAGSFQATLASSDFATGNIFLQGEIDELEKHRPNAGLFVIQVYRDELDRRADARVYVSDGNGGDPFLAYRPEQLGD